MIDFVIKSTNSEVINWQAPGDTFLKKNASKEAPEFIYEA
jgi:hypothetical protein